MPYAPEVDGPDLLGWWIRQADQPTRARRRPTQPAGGLRFGFYGRISTEDFQDRLSSARWQRDFPDEVVVGRGRIVADFFDVGCSRRLPWADRPQAALLLAALTDPDRGFDAIVVGEFERAFYSDQFQRMAPLFADHGVQVWLPELDGPADATNELHLALLPGREAGPADAGRAARPPTLRVGGPGRRPRQPAARQPVEWAPRLHSDLQ